MGQEPAYLYETLRGRNEVVCVDHRSTVLEAARKMATENVGCVLVADGRGRVEGIITEHDIVNRVTLARLDPFQTPVCEVMTRDVITCQVGAEPSRIHQVMADNHIRHLPVFDGNTAVSMISSRDVIHLQLANARASRAAAEEVARLSTHLKSLEFEDVVTMVATEVPRIFRAERSALCLRAGEGGSLR